MFLGIKMLRKILLTGFALFLFLVLLAQPQQVVAIGAREAGASAKIKFKEANQERLEDKRIVRLESFLVSKNSPLASYAREFVFSADRFGFDWRLLPAITGVESSFGRAIPSGSYNAYGWGNGRIYFSSWPESIEVVSQALFENYYQKGLDTPEKIGPVWAPPSPDWASKVRVVMNWIDQFDLAPEPKF
jgi:hypothetical protein